MRKSRRGGRRGRRERRRGGKSREVRDKEECEEEEGRRPRPGTRNWSSPELPKGKGNDLQVQQDRLQIQHLNLHNA